MNETQLQELFRRYRDSQDEEEQEDCVKDVSVLLYGYSKKNFPYDQDLGSDFFLEIYPKISGLMDSYDPSRGVSFKTYLSFRLLYLSRSFFKKTKENNYFVNFYPMEEYLFTKKIRSVFSENHDDDENEERRLLFDLAQKTSGILKMLPSETQVLLKLYYGIPLSLDNYRYILKQRKLENFIDNIRELQDVLEERQKDLTEKETKHKTKMLQYTLLSQHHPSKGKNFSKRYDTLAKKTPIKLKAIRYRELSWLMDMSISTVHRRIRIGEKLLREELKRKFYERKV